MDSTSKPTMHDLGFWRINAGHLLTMFTVVGSVSFVYGQVATKLENQQAEIVVLQQEANRADGLLNTMQISEAASQQDRIDLHKTIEDDFSRRLTKLEDKVETK